MKYLFINSISESDSPISDYRLFSNKKIGIGYHGLAIRIEVPEDLVLEKFVCDDYYTTKDTRLVSEFNPRLVMKTTRGWSPIPILEYKPYDFEDKGNTIDNLQSLGYRFRGAGYWIKNCNLIIKS